MSKHENVIFWAYATLVVGIFVMLMVLDLPQYLIPASVISLAGTFVCLYLILNKDERKT